MSEIILKKSVRRKLPAGLIVLGLLVVAGCAGGGTRGACAELSEIAEDVTPSLRKIDNFAADNEIRNSEANKLKDYGYEILDVPISDRQLAEAAQQAGRGLISTGNALDAATVTGIDFDGALRAGQRTSDGLNEIIRLCS
jgi:hypothetical protein